MTEVWVSKDAHDASLKLPTVKQAIAELLGRSIEDTVVMLADDGEGRRSHPMSTSMSPTSRW